jgi:nicotinamidase-related amidase
MSEGLRSLVDPSRTSILVMEMQRGVVGDLARFPGPAEAVRDCGMVERCTRLYAAGRRAGLRVIHCTAAFRPDRAGSFRNMPMVSQLMDDMKHLPVGSPDVEVLPELRGDDDLESQRLHGISPYAGTALDSLLRSLETRTCVVTGVSLNRGVIGTSIESVNYGYNVVVPRDAVIGYPKEYGEQVLRYTLDGLATLSSVDELVSIWGG